MLAQAGFALVRYQELDADEATGTKLEEWFRLPWLISGEEGAAAAPALQPPAPWHVAEGFRIRPVPPEEVGGWVGGTCRPCHSRRAGAGLGPCACL